MLTVLLEAACDKCGQKVRPPPSRRAAGKAGRDVTLAQFRRLLGESGWQLGQKTLCPGCAARRKPKEKLKEKLEEKGPGPPEPQDGPPPGCCVCEPGAWKPLQPGYQFCVQCVQVLFGCGISELFFRSDI